MAPQTTATSARKKVPSKKASEQLTPIPTDSCFTIMPFGGWFDDYYASVYKPAIEAAGLKPKRADDLYRPSTIVNDIWTYTRAAKLVLADLTGKNANVFYELGLAHALAKPVVLVAESMNDVPFDLRALRVIEYDKNEPRWGDTLRDKIIQSISEVLASPLASVPSAFIEARAHQDSKPITEQEKQFLELRQEIDLLKRELRSTELRNSRSRQLELEVSERDMSIGPNEATELISRYLASAVPEEVILRRLVERGVPVDWIRDELRRQTKPVRAQPPKVVKEATK